LIENRRELQAKQLEEKVQTLDVMEIVDQVTRSP
jgi:hypothetical protein